MTTQAHDTAMPVTSRLPRRAGAGSVQLTQRDIDGLMLCGEHCGAPFDLLAAWLRVSEERVHAITARWRRAGYAATGRLGLGPGWCWLTREGMSETGLGFPVVRPALGRLAHIRAVLAARIWMRDSGAWAEWQPWWQSERRMYASQPAAGRGGHMPDAEVHWPSLDGCSYAGQVWAIEAELTPKAAARTARIMGGLLVPVRYAQVIYLTAPPARPVVLRAVATLPAEDRARVVVRDLPGYALTGEPR
jgi:hypothetical protein